MELKKMNFTEIRVAALPCKAKRQHLLTFQVSRYSRLALQGKLLFNPPLRQTNCSCFLKMLTSRHVLFVMILLLSLYFSRVNSD